MNNQESIEIFAPHEFRFLLLDSSKVKTYIKMHPNTLNIA